jgi:hypothetical protein
MSNREALAIWKKISAIISDEISTNAEFAQKITTALGGDAPSTAPKRRNRRDPAKINPFELLEQGEDKLSQALSILSIEELKDVISENGMDTAKLALKWKDRQRLENHIIEATQRRASKGDAFWRASETEGDA